MRTRFKIPLRGERGAGQHIWVDDVDLDTVLSHGPWYLHSKGYAVNQKSILLHRLVMGLKKGDRRQVDHRDRDPLNCVRSNMRLATSGQNRQNVGSNAGSTSKHRGVSWDTARNRWRAQGGTGYRTVFLGRYRTEQEAADVVARWRAEHMPYALEPTA